MIDKNPIEDLKEIRKMMESSSKFISLSGLSGVFAGLTALVGAYLANQQIHLFEKKWVYYAMQNRAEEGFNELSIRLVFIAACTFITALGGAVLFTWLKAKRQEKKLWTALTFKMIFSLAVPLFLGGLFIIGLYLNHYPELIAPATLLVYGMSLLNASKYVHNDIKYLALCQLVLAVVSLFNLHEGIYFWSIGFGILHIVYGIIMYFKYDRK